MWKLHWIHPLFKHRSQHDPNNYRGLQLTAQISKAAERLLAELFTPHLLRTVGTGFAYTPGRGARDAILYFILEWITAFSQRYRIAVYCSDVSGAFDKVPSRRLLLKLERAGVHPRILAVLESWLVARRAQVVAGGAYSLEFDLADMVFQGTV